MNNQYYFIFSRQHLNKLQETFKTVGKNYTPGTVVVKGVVKQYTEILYRKFTIYSDYIVVAQTDNLDNIKYTEPIIE